MPQLTDDQVRHIAKLARLNLKDEEVGKFSKELTSILSYVDRLQEVDTADIGEMEQVTGQVNGWREDTSAPLSTGEICKDQVDQDALLECSPLPITDHQIQTASAHG